jgi:hypothetical protein
MLPLVAAMALALTVPQTAAADTAAADKKAVVEALTAYHAAMGSGDAASVVAQVGPTLLMAEEQTTGTDRLKAHLFLTGERLANWPANYLKQVGPHESRSAVVSVNVRGDAATVLSRDTGRNAFRSWKDEETAWFLARSDGRWRVVGMIIRDFQVPAAQ